MENECALSTWMLDGSVLVHTGGSRAPIMLTSLLGVTENLTRSNLPEGGLISTHCVKRAQPIMAGRAKRDLRSVP